MAIQAALFAANGVPDLGGLARSEVRQATVLEVRPELFDGIQLPRVGREPDDVPLMMVSEPPTDDVVFVRPATVPEEHDGATEVVGEPLQKTMDLGPADIDLHVQGQRER